MTDLPTTKEWRPFPPIALPSSVFALSSDEYGIWAGGPGGIACYPATGGAWQATHALLPLSSVMALWCAYGTLLVGGQGGIVYSRDGGQSWQQARLEDASATITAFAASPRFADDQTIVAATFTSGILRSNDGGRSWKSANLGLDSLDVSALAWGAGSTLLAACSYGIYRSPNAGRAWHCVYDSEDPGIDALVYLPDGTVVATLEAGGILPSTDGGMHWTTQESALQGLSLFVTPDTTLLMGTVSHGLVRSTDGGATWESTYDAFVHTFTSDRNILYAGTDNGVSFSQDDGLIWQELPPPPLYDFCRLLIQQGQPLLAGSYSGLLHYTSEQGWLHEALPAHPLTAAEGAPDGSLLLALSGGLARFTGYGIASSVELPGPAEPITHITFRQHQGWIARRTAGGTEILRRRAIYGAEAAQAEASAINGAPTQEGASWQVVASPFGILMLVALQATEERLLAATYDIRQYRVCIWISLDDGVTWERSIEAETDWPLVAICAHPTLIAIDNVILLERATGWQRVTVGGRIIRVISSQRNGTTLLFALTTTGILRSEDDGASWLLDDEALSREQVIDMAATDTTLFVLLTGGRIWQRDLP